MRAELRETGDPLPRIPPLSASLGASYHGPRWYSSAYLRYTGEQDEVAAFETETDDFTMIDASLGYRIVTGDVIHKISLRGRNLSDQEGRNHVSQLKDLILLPGRDISIGYEVTF